MRSVQLTLNVESEEDEDHHMKTSIHGDPTTDGQSLAAYRRQNYFRSSVNSI